MSDHDDVCLVIDQRVSWRLKDDDEEDNEVRSTREQV